MTSSRPFRPTLTALSITLLLSACGTPPPPTVEVNLAVINDLHGYLQPTEQPYRDPTAAEGRRTIRAGGIETLGGLIDDMRKQDAQLLLIGNGDLIGGSPALSAMWADEPTILALNRLGLQLSSVGNHELDNGKDELRRMIDGGCESNRPGKACQFQPDYPGADFPYLAANLIDTKTGKPLVQPYQVLEAHGQKIAFVGAVLQDLPKMVPASGMKGLTVGDEADAINALVPALKAQGVSAIVAVIHQGGGTPEAYNQANCENLQGPIVDLAKRLDPAIDLVASAHTHQSYTCRVDGRPVFQGGSYGQFVSHIRLKIDPRLHRVTDVRMENLEVDPNRYAPNKPLAALRQQVETLSQALLERPVARLGAEHIGRVPNAAGETAMGNLVADAQHAALLDQGAQVAFMNRGGLRSDLSLEPGQRQLTYAQLASTQPFANTLTLLTMSGEQLRRALERQWRADGSANVLQVSKGIRYEWDESRPLGQRIVPGTLKIDGQLVRDTATYKVVASNFLADGGEGFAEFAQAQQRIDTGITDITALEHYLVAQDKAGLPAGKANPEGRIQRR
jgi:5'-nucleotidase